MHNDVLYYNNDVLYCKTFTVILTITLNNIIFIIISKYLSNTHSPHLSHLYY